VKIQVEFNPAKVAGYRLIGYENRVLAAEDFNDDKKDAGEIGAGHTVTALYELVPAGKKVDATDVDELKYRSAPDGQVASATSDDAEAESSDELLTLKIRYKEPDGDKSAPLEFPISDNGQSFAKATDDFKFASAVASFGMLLRDSQYKGNATFAAVAEIAEAASRNRDPHGYRKEFVEMVQRARQLSGK
jgi:Ca-activated chloride channel family protein